MLVGGASGCGGRHAGRQRLLSAQGERGPDNLSGDGAGGGVEECLFAVNELRGGYSLTDLRCT